MPEQDTTPPITPVAKAATLEKLLTSVTPKMELVAPKGYDVQRLSGIMVDLLMATPDLLACAETPAGKNSFATAVMHIAALGLDASRVRKQVYVIPFKTSKKDKSGNWLSFTCAVLVLDARGLIELIRRSGLFEGVIAKPVYKTDRFRYIEAPEPMIEHEPDLDREPFANFWPPIIDDPSGAKDKYGKPVKVYDWSDPNCEAAQLRGFYCMIRVKGETPLIGWMSMDAMLKRKAQSRASGSGPWIDWFVEMGIKTIVKATARHAPLSAEVMRAFALDDEIETGERPALPQRSADGKQIDLSDVIEYEEGDGSALPEPEKPAPTKTDAVKERLASKNTPKPEPPAPAPAPAATVVHGETGIGMAPEGDDSPFAAEEAEEKPQNGDSTPEPPAVEQNTAPAPPAPQPNPAPQQSSPASSAPDVHALSAICAQHAVGSIYTQKILALSPPSKNELDDVLCSIRGAYEDIRDGFAVALESGSFKTWAAFKAFAEQGVMQQSIADQEYDPLTDQTLEPEEEPAPDPSQLYRNLAVKYSLTPKSRDWMLEHAPSPSECDAYFEHVRQSGKSVNGQLSMHLAEQRSWAEATAHDGFEFNEGAQ